MTFSKAFRPVSQRYSADSIRMGVRVERTKVGERRLLTKEELANLRSQIVTSNRGGLRYCPYAFTEHGIVMLASLLKSATAMEVSVRIVNAFVAMRKFILANAQLFQRIEGVEQRQVATECKVVFFSVRHILQ